MTQHQVIRQKRLKAGTACIHCRKKKLRCTGTPNCARCVSHKLECIVDEVLFFRSNNTGDLPRSKSMASIPYSSLGPNIIQQQRCYLTAHKGHHYQCTPSPDSCYNRHYRAQSHPHHVDTHYYHCDHSTSASYVFSFSGDEATDQKQGRSTDTPLYRRPSTSSLTSYSSQSPNPSSPYSFQQSLYRPTSVPLSHDGSPCIATSMPLHFNTKDGSSNKRAHLDPPIPLGAAETHSISPRSEGFMTAGQPALVSSPIIHDKSSLFSASLPASLPLSPTKLQSDAQRQTELSDRVIGLERNMSPSQNQQGVNSSLATPSPVLKSQSSLNATEKEGEYKSMLSTMSLDGHGQHFHGSSSGFYVCQLSNRYRHGLYPMPIVHLNDSDIWLHSLQMTSERELPSTVEMEYLLDLYFRYMYPVFPIFIRQTFMQDHRQKRLNLAQILVLNAIFCNACCFSDATETKQDSIKYFNRAKLILDETYHISSISTVQALLLMSHYQYTAGNYSGGWLYTGMATRVALDIGLHRRDAHPEEPEQAEARKRTWWILYITDRIGSGILGRPIGLRDGTFNVEMPSGDWVYEMYGQDIDEYPYGSEHMISCCFLWSVKLLMQMEDILNAMHCIEAELNSSFLAEASRTQLPQLHHKLISWFVSLPSELAYTPYTTMPGSNLPPSPAIALMHMFYYTCLTILHRPYLRPVNSALLNANFLASSRNICITAATNICHIADSLILHGQLRETCYYGIECLLAAGTVHAHNAITPTLSAREATHAGLSKIIKAGIDFVKTFPAAESLVAIALDVFAGQANPLPSEMAAPTDVSSLAVPFMDMSHLQSMTAGNIYEAAQIAKMAKDGPTAAPSIQLRHPYGGFSIPLPEVTNDQDSAGLSALWQTHIARAIALTAITFGGSVPQQGHEQQHQQKIFTNPLDVPEALRLDPIETIVLSQVDPIGILHRQSV
ncbi:Transcriptional activator of fatty acid utilization [Lobosporangium transversale]|uniref:Fungal-specific transcription factor domain-domain-containing protein n=1 Tax=Lobosporangium transversale TaxID=64571 RepID=A0A1Y2GRM1_9FUNG|nr:fungal-specific transcription factor domain-domain-containing protein [Lobosporangium transversale]KAF9915211.1 Transcriptional activator of fatty acid utilization [Lobosporangium transversale]ORZ20157.1 fungal-specific transcription factor domain-domain-containing protein [Lobosporangium transversale]|eukprot:XP_021882697.1 fungal-specific transcription factor domain-domain-containing protein [Lobosporangium transversale]